MNDLNSVLIEGTVSGDIPQLKTTPKGLNYIFSLECNRYVKNETGGFTHEYSFVDVEICGKLAEKYGGKIKNGQGVRVVGRLSQYRWTDSNGESCSKISVIAEHIEFKQSFNKNIEAEEEFESTAEYL